MDVVKPCFSQKTPKISNENGMVNLHILASVKISKTLKTYKKEPKTLVFGSFLTESVISVNVDVFNIRKSYTVIMILQFKSLLCQTPLYEFLDDYITFTTCNDLILTTIIGNRMTKTPSNQKIIRCLIVRVQKLSIQINFLTNQIIMWV